MSIYNGAPSKSNYDGIPSMSRYLVNIYNKACIMSDRSLMEQLVCIQFSSIYNEAASKVSL